MSGRDLRCRLGWHHWHRTEFNTWRHLWGRTYRVEGMRWCLRASCDASEATRHEVFL